MALGIITNRYNTILSSSNDDFYYENVRFPPIQSNDSKLTSIAESTFLPQINKDSKINFNRDLEKALKSDVNTILNADDTSYFRLFLTFFSSRPTFEIRSTRLYALYVLSLANASKVHESTFSEDLFQRNLQRELIFHEDIFPIDPTTNECKFDYIKKVNHLLFQSVTLIPEKDQNNLYKKILEYCYPNDEARRTIYNFLPLILEISEYKETPEGQGKPDIKEIFLKSELFARILKECENDIVLFDIVRFFIEKNPFESLILNKSFREVLPRLYFKPNYQVTIVEIITAALKEVVRLQRNLNNLTDQNQQEATIKTEQLEVIQIIENIIDQCNNDQTKKREFREVYPAIKDYFPQFSDNIFEFIIEENIFENLAKLSIYSQELLQHYIQLLTGMYSRHYEFEYRMSSRKYKIYDTIEEYKQEFPELELLKQLSFCSESNNNENKYIRNYKGIEVMISLFPLMGEHEHEFSDFLYIQASNAGNLLELSRAKVPEFILKRLKEIKKGELKNIVNNYIKLFKLIGSVVFSNSTFYRTIETLRCKTFEYGNDVINIIRDLILVNDRAENDKKEPISFFRLDAGIECGIFGPKLKNEIVNNFSINFCIRINQISDGEEGEEGEKEDYRKKYLPLFYIQSNASKAKIGLGINKGELYLIEVNSRGEVLKQDKIGDIKLQQGQWEFLQVSFSKGFLKREMTVVHNSEEKSVQKLKNSIDRDSFIFFGTESKDSDSKSLMCDISTIIITEGDGAITKEDLLDSYGRKQNDKIVSELNPTNGHERICFDTGNNDGNIVEYRGRSIPFIPNIYEVFQTVGSLINILPLFKHKEKTNEETTQFLVSLLQIIKRMVTLTKEVKAIFTESRFFELLQGFLLEINSKILTIEFMTEIFDLYKELYQIEELRYQMAQHIILNYTLIMRLMKPVYEKVINELIPQQVIVDKDSDSYHYSYLPSFIFQTYKFFSMMQKKGSSNPPTVEREIADKAWSILTTMIKHNLELVRRKFGEKDSKKYSYDYIMMIYKFMMNLATDYVVIKCLEVLKNLLSENYREVNECLKDETVIGPFVSLMGQKSDDIQVLALQVIDQLKRDINFHKTIIQCMYALNSENEITTKLVNETFNLFIVYDPEDSNKLIEFNADYLPFLASICNDYCGEDKQLVTKICEKFTDFLSQYQKKAYLLLGVPCWYDWMRDLFRIVYDPKKSYKMFSFPFASLLELDFRNCDIKPTRTLFYSLDNSDAGDTRDAKTFILSKLIHDNDVGQEQALAAYPLIFDHLVFEKTPKFGKETSCTFKFRTLTQENIKEEEVELAKALIYHSLGQGDSSNIKTKIGGYLDMEIVFANSIVTAMLLRWKPNDYADAVRQIKKNLKSGNADLNQKCASVLVEPFIGHEFKEGEEGLKAAIESLDEYLNKNGSRMKDKAIQDKRGAAIDEVENCKTSFQGYYMIEAQEVINERNKDITENLGVKIDNEEEDSLENRREAFVTALTTTILNPDTSRGVSYDNRAYLVERNNEYKTEVKRIEKMKDSFLKSLLRRPGPWLDEKDDDTKYMAFNHISKRGQRVMLKVNDQFDDHRDASANMKENRSLEAKDTKTEQKTEEYQMPYKTSEDVDEFYLMINQFNAILQEIANNYEGVIKFTDRAISFISGKASGDKKGIEDANKSSDSDDEDEDDGDHTFDKKLTIEFKNIMFVLDRRVYREEKGCEIFLDNYKSYFIYFPNKEERDRFYAELDTQITAASFSQEDQFTTGNNKFNFFQSLRQKCNSIHQTKPSKDLISDLRLDILWQNNKLTNYEYLYYLNILGGRSFNYPNQYPIFPLLIKECKENHFDLTNDSMYRDLGLPVMKLNPDNFQNLLRQYQGADPDHKCLVFTMPSSGFYPALAMCRVEPFTTLQVSISTSGSIKKFDDTNRQFYSIPVSMYEAVYETYSQNLCEAIPEFFTFPFMFFNENKFDFGERTDDPKGPIDNVILPPWCQFEDERANETSHIVNSHIFSSVCRIALESEYASKNLHKWINLYFTKGRGYCYEDDSNKKDQPLYQMFESYSYPENLNPSIYIPTYEHIGMLPEILFDRPHVKKNLAELSVQSETQKHEHFPAVQGEKITNIIKDVAISENLVLFDLENIENNGIKAPSNIGELQCVVRNSQNESEGGSLAVFCTKSNPFVTVQNMSGGKKLSAECHITSTVTSVTSVGNRFLIVGGSDASLSVWKVSFKKRNTGILNRVIHGSNEGGDEEFEIKQVCSSCFHTAEIASIGGCYENGLVVSLDKRNILIFETLFDQRFINFADLSSKEMLEDGEGFYDKTQIFVYKSGTVAVVQRKRVLFFDSHGKLIYIWKLDSIKGSFGVKKYYDIDTREMLIVGYKEGDASQICIFDITLFRTADTIKTKLVFDHFCPINKIRKIILSNKDGFSTIDFGYAIKTNISPDE
ncbi:hypothetical protein M9Y10_009174 [Tritrichomonas musculus]|uniref:Beige/BEACH domain containing protein n=1 Tax=Tritrichomonas musculus TaxID=1915356 RepID=A0ABR2IMS3_9EUKA